MSDRGYMYDPSTEHERARLSALELINDPHTFRHLSNLGISKEWRCLEVGGGGGSVVSWLCENTAHVVATDLDTRYLKALPYDNLDVREHNILTDPLEENAFDVVHSRFVLEHLREYERALDRMIAATKPGGWIVAEDIDFIDMSTPDPALPPQRRDTLATFFQGMRAFGRSRGIPEDCGRRLPHMFVARKLEEVGGEGRRVAMRGGTPSARMAKLTTEALRDQLVTGGFVTAEVIELAGSYLDDPKSISLGPLVVATWGRKPK